MDRNKIRNILKGKTAKRVDVMKDGLNSDIRSYARVQIANVLNDEEMAENIEKQIFNKHKKDPSEYNKAITYYTTFLDPENRIGKYSNLFRTKVKNNIYSNDRLPELNVEDFLPEVFIRDDISVNLKKEILRYLEDKSYDNIETMNIVANPGKSIQTKPSRMSFYDFDELNKIKNVKGLCYNPHWDANDATTIICKENGKFYCLDAKELVPEILETGTAKNKYTGKELSKKIIKNLKNRYSDHPVISTRTEIELERLIETKQNLSNLLESLDTNTLVENGLDPDIFSQPLINAVPGLVRDTFNKKYETVPQEAAEYLTSEIGKEIQQLNNIIDGSDSSQNINQEIESVMSQLGLDSDSDSELEEVDFLSLMTLKQLREMAKDRGIETDGLKKADLIKKLSWAQMDQGNSSANMPSEEDLINSQILVDKSVSKGILDEYLGKLTSLRDTVVEKIEGTIGEPYTQLSEILIQLDSEIAKLLDSVKSITGIQNMLQQKIGILQQKMSDREKQGIELAYPGIDPEYTQIKECKENCEKELEYISGLQN